MTNVSVSLRGKNPTTKPMSVAKQLGWNDANTGRGFRPEYETLPEVSQLSYERGRMARANLPRNEVHKLTPTGRMSKADYETIQRRTLWGINDRVFTRLDDDPSLSFPSTLNRRGFPKPIPTFCAR